MIPFYVATLAPIISIIQSCPQLYKTYITKSVNDLSLYSIILMLISALLWLLHGYFISDNSSMIAGGMNLIINAILLVLYFLYRKK